MSRKSLRTCVLLVGLLLGTASSAFADALSITTLSLSNLQIVPTAGTITFFAPEFSPGTTAFARATNSLGEEIINRSESLTSSQAAASVTFANGSAVSNFTNGLFSTNSNVMLSGCNCSAFAAGSAFLLESFIITGGTGNVNVNVSGLAMTLQTLMTDQFGLLAESNVIIGLHISGAHTIFTATIFSVDSNLRIGPNSSTGLETERELSQLLTLQFNQEYTVTLTMGGNSIAQNQAEIPEPATVVLLVSGLGFMAGFVKKRRR